MRRAVQHLRQADSVLCTVIDRVGACKMRYLEPNFETVVRSIVFQQLSGRSARAIFGRVRMAAAGHGRLGPARVLACTDAQLRAAGLSQQKMAYLRDLAEKTRRRRIRFARLPQLSDEEVIRQLTVVKGVGVWTAQMFLLFALRRPNVLAAGDLGVRTAIQRLYDTPAIPTPRRVEEIAQAWHPYCSAACWYLWRSLELPQLVQAGTANDARQTPSAETIPPCPLPTSQDFPLGFAEP